LKLAPHERRELKKMAASRTMKAGEVRRAKVILRLAAGQSYRTIMKQEGCGQDFVARWKERFWDTVSVAILPRWLQTLESTERIVSQSIICHGCRTSSSV
jgi:hypothetical protein